MLEAMRRGAQTWVAKILFGLLVFSFAIWGVADVFTGWGRGAIATVGSTPITVEEFNRSFQSELDQFSRRANKRITPEQGRALGLDQRVLNQLVGGAAIEQHANDLGLALSDATVAEIIANDDDFKGADGKFSREGFNGFLRQVGLTEKGFINLRRRDELRGDLIGAFVKAQTVPKPMLETLYAYNEEKRIIEFIDIDAEKAVTVAEPDEAKLKERYEAGKAGFMTPEYRKFEVVFLSADDLKKTIEISDTDIAAEYEKTKESYNTPEMRRIQQIAFKDKAAAGAAKAALDSGKSFGEVATQAGAKDTDVDLGLIAKNALIDKKVADAAFALEKDKISEVIEGTFATVIVRVTQIEPGVVKTLDDVKGDVKEKLTAAKARDVLQEKHDEIDDERNAGKTLKEISDARKLTYKEVAAADNRGIGPDGQPVLDATDLRKVMENVFSPDAGTDQMSFEVSDGKYAWINYLSSEAPKQKTFDEVKDEVKAQHMTSERNRLISELAAKLAGRINNGEPMSAVAPETGGKSVQKTDAVTRSTVPQGLSEAAVAQAFALQPGKAGTAETADRQSRVILRVAEVIKAPAPADKDLEKIAKEIEPELANQTLVEYTEALKSRLGASINEGELKRALGTTDE